jgi:hypothetical protein
MHFTPDRDNVMRRYEFAVIIETDEDHNPPVAKSKGRLYRSDYQKAQIIVCETTGGNSPIEVGTWGKPRKVGCHCVVCGTMQEAINMSYAVADETYDPKIDYRGVRKSRRTKQR